MPPPSIVPTALKLAANERRYKQLGRPASPRHASECWHPRLAAQANTPPPAQTKAGAGKIAPTPLAIKSFLLLRAIHDYFRRWTDDRTLDRLHQALYVRCRELAVRVERFSNSLADGRSLAALKYYSRALSRPRISLVDNSSTIYGAPLP
jgi:hypothetical protein